MRIAVLGTGMVGETIASRLVELGHDVAMGSRSATNEKAVAWAAQAGGRAATFADAARDAELVFNCTRGEASLEVLRAAGVDGKIVIDVSNPLDFSTNPPSLSVCNTDSLGEQLQRAFPAAKIVKALNTMNCKLMVAPRSLAGEHVTFLCGDDAAAKARTREVLQGFGWREHEIVDLGGIAGARGTEAYLLLWLKMWQATGTGAFNINIVK
jgi:8-hydroxy-5-deazaflavin:NADPH oxidoreductase